MLTLQRLGDGERGTLGRLTGRGLDLCTIELPWLDNRRMVSRIPAGEYVCKPAFFNRGGYDTWEVTEVPDRSHVLFHVANTILDLNGCIGVGLTFGELHIGGQDYPAVMDSRDAFFDHFMPAFEDVGRWTFRIYDPDPELPEPDIELVDSTGVSR